MKPKCYNKRGKRSKENPIFNLREAARQWRANWRATKPTGKPAACSLWNLASGTPAGEQLARARHCCAFQPKFSAYKRENLGHLERTGKLDWAHLQGTFERLEELEEHWDLLGIKWGSLERFGYSSFVVVSFSLFFTTLQCTLSQFQGLFYLHLCVTKTLIQGCYEPIYGLNHLLSLSLSN